MTAPAVANGIPVSLFRPSDSAVAARAIDASAVPILFNGAVVALSAPLTLGGVPAVPSLVSVTTFNGVPCVLVGSVVTCADGFIGTLGPEHGAGPTFDVL